MKCSTGTSASIWTAPPASRACRRPIDYLRVLRQINRNDGEGKEVPEADPPVKTLSLHARDVADDRCHAVQDRLHRAEGFRRFAFREADPRSIPFRAVRIRRITGIR